MANLKRRDFLKSAITAGIAASLPACSDKILPTATRQPSRAKSANLKPQNPNVIFIMSDDLCTALSGFGHPQCKTPNLDKLAERGTKFQRAYCQFPLCGPSRASLMTGMYPQAIGSITNHKSLFRKRHPNLVTMSQLFMQNGYHTVRVSKIYHMGIPGEIMSGTAKHDDPKSWGQTFNIKAAEMKTPGKFEDLSPGVKHQGADFNLIKATGEDNLHADVKAVDKAIEVLRDRPKDKPIFLATGLVRPHVPLLAPKRFFEPYKPENMKLPENPADDLKDIPRAALTQANSRKYRMTKAQQKKALAGYYASVAFMDAQVGRLIAELKAQNMYKNSIIIFSSDHGYNLGQHTCWQKLSLFEDSIRVPLIVCAPGKKQVPQTDSVVELIDLYPTLAELAQIKPPANLQGKSFAPLLTKQTAHDWKNKPAYVITKNRGQAIVTKRWKLIAWSNGRKGTELYDLKLDPNEFDNLAGKKEYAKTLAKMKMLLRKQTRRARKF